MAVPTTYPKFLEKIKEYETGEISSFIKGSSTANDFINGYFNIFGRLMPAIYILDYTQKKYVYASGSMKSFIDYPISKLLDGGLDFCWDIFQKDDLKIYGEKVLYENLKFLKSVPISKHADFLFTCNYRVKNRRGDYRQIRQQSVFIKSNSDGMPLATIGFLYDLSDYMNKTKIVHTISALSTNKKAESRLLLNNTYFPHEEDSVLSPREIEVLKWICEGITSKEIADKLHRSVNTINNHRRHILEKTNSKGLVDLIKFAVVKSYL